MRLGVNLLCVAGQIDVSHRPIFELALRAGFDGVEIPVFSGDPDHYARLGAVLDELGLARTMTTIIASPEASPVSPDPKSRALARQRLNWTLDCAVALGAESIGGPFHAPIGHFTGAGPTESEFAWGAAAHRRLAERAAKRGIILALEPLNRFETYFLNTAEQAASYAARVDHPAFKIMYDSFHANIEERSQTAAIETLGDLIGVAHVSENDRGVPGRGQIDFASIFRALRRTGFDGWVVVEAFGAALPELATATRVWRPLFPDHETLFVESARFVRETWEAAAPKAPGSR